MQKNYIVTSVNGLHAITTEFQKYVCDVAQRSFFSSCHRLYDAFKQIIDGLHSKIKIMASRAVGGAKELFAEAKGLIIETLSYVTSKNIGALSGYVVIPCVAHEANK